MVYYLQSINRMGMIDLGESSILLLVFDSDTVKAEIGGCHSTVLIFSG